MKACKMNVVNLARVFGPTLVGHSCSDPEPLQMLNDTKLQPAVRINWFIILFYYAPH